MTLFREHYYVAPGPDWHYYTVYALVAVPELLLSIFAAPLAAWLNRSISISRPVTPWIVRISGLVGLVLPAVGTWLVHYHQPICVGCYSK